MRRRLLLSLLVFGCGQSATAPQPDMATATGPVLPGPSRGSAVALSPDDSIAVVVNRDASSVTVLQMTYDGATPSAAKSTEVTVGAEPWQVAVAPDGDTAFVVTRKDQQLVRIDHLKTAPEKGASVQVGSEPTAVALTPTGAQAWVANWVDGTLTAVDTATMTVAATVDLNDALAKSGLLGTVTARPALAHPRSLAISNNGDHNDGDEELLATEFFAQRTEPEKADGSNADTSKEGIVYRVKLSDRSIALIPLSPLADMGFKDHANGSAGCYPNQLQSVSINNGFAYVTSICASPKGPLGPFDNTKTTCSSDADCEPNGGKCTIPAGAATGNCGINAADVKTANAPLISVIDLTAEKQVSQLSLNAAFQQLYASKATADDGTRRYPLVPTDVAFVPGTSIGYVPAGGADSVFRAVFDNGSLKEVGSSTNLFINLTPAMPPEAAGRAPIGLAVTQADHGGRVFALSANDITRNLSVIDLATQAIAGGNDVIPTTALPAAGSPEDHVLRGKRFFLTGTARWSLKGQAWNACQTCHVDGLTDNVTWYFARGPRQSISLDGSFSKKDGSDQRIFNWTAIFDEISDFEGNTRGVSGGVGAIVKTVSAPPAATDRIDFAGLGHAGLNGSSLAASSKTNPPDNFSGFTGQLDDWSDITAYIKTVRSPRRPSNLDSSSVTSGKSLFEAANCQGCHGGDKWTLSKLFYAPDKNVSNLATNLNARLVGAAWTPPAGFPQALLPATTTRVMRFGGGNPAAFDQIQCVLRPVGTFGTAESDVAAGGLFPELRVDMLTKGQGSEADGNGFNPPSLLGNMVGAPYLHAGQARTLEALFSPTFLTHTQALNSIFLDPSDAMRDAKISQLVQYLLSIDADTAVEAIPAAGATGGDFCAPPM